MQDHKAAANEYHSVTSNPTAVLAEKKEKKHQVEPVELYDLY